MSAAAAFLLSLSAPAFAHAAPWQEPPPAADPVPAAAAPWLDEALPGLIEVYRALHRQPELSYQEQATAAALAGILRDLGYELTTDLGGHGVAGVLRNGPGPVLLLRTDMDALPITEATGLPFASAVRAANQDGSDTGVMHACGHDLHMTVWIGTATWLARHRERWSGTLVCIAQPAEECGTGARAMLEDGLYARTARPDFALALHVTEQLPVGAIGFRPGYALANVDSVDILVRGQGGHGSAPHTTHDPIALAARLVIGLQHIVSREIKPIDDAVVTVGSIHGGTKHNIIPDEVRLQLTVRSYTPEVRRQVLDAIERVARHEASAAGFPEELLPVVKVRADEFTPAVFNDPELVASVNRALAPVLGGGRLQEVEPSMGGEDFARYGPAAGCPSYIYWLGTSSEERWRAARTPGAPPLPSLHTASFAPQAEGAIRTGVVAMTTAVLALLGTDGEGAPR